MVLSLIQDLLHHKEKTLPLMAHTEAEDVKEQILKTETSLPLALLPEEQNIVRQIRRETNSKNLNNITRTKAYLDFYKGTPEIEWSFLAHMVSRNAGYHMTDLKGSVLPVLLEKEEAAHFYLFLEKANAFIFQDAYPQLLLYKKSVEEKKPLFHLLSAFKVSKAMRVFWERFWKEKNKSEMTIAMIINEQSMLQTRLISGVKEGYSFEKLLFLLQDRLELTTVFFPYKKNRWSKKPYSLAGTGISHFESTKNRIETGKKLYSILFQNKVIKESASDFAFTIPHTGSRSDYWPRYYTKQVHHKDKIFSPSLETLWDDQSHSYSQRDWLNLETIRYVNYLKTLPANLQYDVTARGILMAKLVSEVKSVAT